MHKITAATIPDQSFMQTYRDMPGCHSDAFKATVNFPVKIEDLVSAFFTSAAFLPERILIKLFTRKDASLEQATKLASGSSDKFALWRTEQRSETEILLAVGSGPIKSWFLIRPEPGNQTTLFFGSAVLPQGTSKDGIPEVSFTIKTLEGFHNFYSRFLLKSALKKLNATKNQFRLA